MVLQNARRAFRGISTALQPFIDYVRQHALTDLRSGKVNISKDTLAQAYGLSKGGSGWRTGTADSTCENAPRVLGSSGFDAAVTQ